MKWTVKTLHRRVSGSVYTLSLISGEVTYSFISCGCGGGTLLARVFDELTSDRLLGDDEMSDEMG